MKTKNSIILIFTSLALSGCFSAKVQFVELTQLKSNLPTIIRCDTIDNTIGFIGFCLVYKIKNKKFKEIKVHNSTYNYRGLYTNGVSGSEMGISPVYLKGDNNELIRIGVNDKRRSFRKEKELIFMTRHNPDSFPEVKKFITPYIERMKAQKKDTLHIESIQELKKTNPEFIANVFRNDTIIVTITGDERFGRYIYFPMKVKIK